MANTTKSITTRSEFIGELPATLEIAANENKIIVVNKLRNSEITINKDANVTFVALLQEGWEDLQKLNFHFEGENSTVTFLAIILGKNDNKFPFETISNHKVPHTNAYYYVRSAMFDKSQIDYKGNLIIKPAAQLTDSYLAHHTLMLSKDAKTNTVPSLEIEADDVKAGHAATIGNVDEDLIFYLQSRGLDKKTGQELMIKGFLEADLKKIPNEEIQSLLSKEIEQSLNAESKNA